MHGDEFVLTDALSAARGGDREAYNAVFAAVHAELVRLARSQKRRHAPDATLDTTALVHETYLKLARPANLGAEDRTHFFVLAAKAMRQILISAARKRWAQKRGGGARSSALPILEGEDLPRDAPSLPLAELLAIHQALDRLEATDPDLAQLVELRFFAGLTEEEIAGQRGVSTRTVRRDWKAARAFLLSQLGAARRDPS